MAPLRKCLYEELNVPRTADDAAIRKAYRAAALANHPDKNRGTDEDAAEERFKAVQHAYEVLSDSHERAWYDSHRDAILRGRDPADGTHPGEDGFAASATNVDLFSFFTSSAYAGFDDGPDSFFEVYANVFETLAAEEREAGASQVSASFGGSDAEWSTVRNFYRAWDGFSSRKAFGHADKWNLADAPNREIRRGMERENKRERVLAKKEFNALVRDLVSFVKKRDIRVKARKVADAEEKSERERLAREKHEFAKAERKERAADTRAQRDEAMDEDANALDDILAQMALDDKLERNTGSCRRRRGRLDSSTDDDVLGENVHEDEDDAEDCGYENAETGNDDGDADAAAGSSNINFAGDQKPARRSEQDEDDAEQQDDDDTYCFVCRKLFKTPAQKLNHEKSKKHIVAATSLRKRLEAEDARFSKKPVPASTATAVHEHGSFGDINAAKNAEDDAPIARLNISKKKKQKRRDTQAALNNCAGPRDDNRSLNSGGGGSDVASATDDGGPAAEVETKTPYDGDDGSNADNDASSTRQDSKADRRRKRKQKKLDKAAAVEKTGSIDPSTKEFRCNVCNNDFPTRNKLFTHVKQKGHAIHVDGGLSTGLLRNSRIQE
jgi:DnaJ homolog subfamily A member 5